MVRGESIFVLFAFFCKAKVHSHSVDPQKNRRNYLINRSIKKNSNTSLIPVTALFFDIYIYNRCRL